MAMPSLITVTGSSIPKPRPVKSTVVPWRTDQLLGVTMPVFIGVLVPVDGVVVPVLSVVVPMPLSVVVAVLVATALIIVVVAASLFQAIVCIQSLVNAPSFTVYMPVDVGVQVAM
jgi:hypothetical protein